MAPLYPMTFQLKKHKIPTPYLVGPVDIFEVTTQGKRLLFDTGPQTSEAMNYLRQHLKLESLDYLFITHCHPDHYGLARFIEENSPAQVILCQRDILLFERFGERIEFLEKEFQAIGFPPELMAYFAGLIPRFQGDIPFPKQYHALEEVAQLLEELQIGWLDCPGHSQSDIVYLLGKRAITGDTLLRKIFTAPLLDMDVTGQGRFSNYRAYCASIPKLMSLQDQVILPSHNDYIDSVAAQIRFYVDKTIARAAKLLPLTKKGLGDWEILQQLFPQHLRPKEYFKLYVKIGELRFFQDFIATPQTLYQALESQGILDEALEVNLQPFV